MDALLASASTPFRFFQATFLMRDVEPEGGSPSDSEESGRMLIEYHE